MQTYRRRNIKDTSGHNMVRIEKRERILVPAYLFGHQEFRGDKRTIIVMKYDSEAQKADILRSVRPSNWITIVKSDNDEVRIVDAGTRNTLKYIAKRIFFGREKVPCLKHSMQYFYSGRLMWLLRKYKMADDVFDFSWASKCDSGYFQKWLRELYSIETVVNEYSLAFASQKDKEMYNSICSTLEKGR